MWVCILKFSCSYVVYTSQGNYTRPCLSSCLTDDAMINIALTMSVYGFLNQMAGWNQSQTFDVQGFKL